MRRCVLLALMLAACGDDADPMGDTGAVTCATENCDDSSATAATTFADSGDSTESCNSTTSSPETTTTSSSEGSSSSSTGPICVEAACIDCFSCSYDGPCFDVQSQCSVDPTCSVALICVRDCVETSRDPTTCVAACDCPSDGAFAALFTCVTDVCVPNGSCPELAC